MIQREVIIRLAMRHKLPSIFFERFFVAAGGLASYGPDIIASVPPVSRLHRSHSQGRKAG